MDTWRRKPLGGPDWASKTSSNPWAQGFESLKHPGPLCWLRIAAEAGDHCRHLGHDATEYGGESDVAMRCSPRIMWFAVERIYTAAVRSG